MRRARIMSNNWPMVPLGEVIDHRKEFIEIDDFTEYKRCRVQSYAKGVVLRDIIQGMDIKTKKQQVCQAGEFLVAEIDAKVGGYGIVPKELDGAIVSSHYFLYVIDETKLNPDFLGYYICTPTFFDQISAQGSTNYAAIRPHHVLEYGIPLPPFDEQRRIVARIEELTAKVEQGQSLRQRSVMEVNSLVTSLHLKLADKVVKIEKFLELNEERTKVELGNTYPQIGIRGFGRGIFSKETVDATQTSYKWFSRLFEGAIGVCPPSLAGYYSSPEYRTFRCIEDEAIPEYLAAIFSTPWYWTQLKNIQRGLGGRRQRTRPEHFLQMEIPMPKIEQQRRAIQVFEKLRPIKRYQADTAAKLDALLPSILDKAFKGEL